MTVHGQKYHSIFPSGKCFKVSAYHRSLYSGDMERVRLKLVSSQYTAWMQNFPTVGFKSRKMIEWEWRYTNAAESCKATLKRSSNASSFNSVNAPDVFRLSWSDLDRWNPLLELKDDSDLRNRDAHDLLWVCWEEVLWAWLLGPRHFTILWSNVSNKWSMIRKYPVGPLLNPAVPARVIPLSLIMFGWLRQESISASSARSLQISWIQCRWTQY